MADKAEEARQQKFVEGKFEKVVEELFQKGQHDDLFNLRSKEPFFFGTGFRKPYLMGAPWTVPRTLPSAYEVNTMLDLSLTAQMSCIPGTRFAECVMSGDSLTANGLMYGCLKAAGLKPTFHVGFLKVGIEALPLVWLTAQGTLIDNTYHFWPAGGKRAYLDQAILDLKRVEHYCEEDPTTTQLPLLTELGSKTCLTDPKLMKAFATPENIEKFLHFRSSLPAAYPNVTVYFALVVKPGSKWERICWTCEKRSPMSLKACAVCKVAKYCDASCQKADWSLHKLLHKDGRTNELFWQEKAPSSRR